MDNMALESLIFDTSTSNVILFALLILVGFAALILAFWYTWRFNENRIALSPYSGMPLRRGADLSYYSMERVLRYLYTHQDYRNRIFKLSSAAVCRETGRIFPNSIGWWDTIHVTWDFLQKQFPGKYVSWGSLTQAQQKAISEMHHSLEGFQTDQSSKEPQPKLVEPQFALLKPGPLYVDMETYTLLGWKIVPDTDLEVLVVQRPRRTRSEPHL